MEDTSSSVQPNSESSLQPLTADVPTASTQQQQQQQLAKPTDTDASYDSSPSTVVSTNATNTL